MTLGLTLLLAAAVMAATAKEGPVLTRQEAEHRFGTPPGAKFLPKAAVDTEQVPEYTLGENDPDDAPLPVFRLDDDSWMFFGNIAEVDENNRGWNGNAGFVVTTGGVVVIDALGSPKLGRRMIATIRSITDEPIRYLIITHNHPDHAYGAVAFRRLGGVTIVGHRDILKYIHSERIDSSVAYRRTFIPGDMAGFEAVEPDILLDLPLYGKRRISVGAHVFDIYNVGAQHSYGDLVVHQMPNNIVWVADLVFNNRVTFMADGHSQLAIEGQQWLARTFPDARLMVPGHGSAQTSPFPMVEKTRSYMVRLREMMASAVEDNVDLQDAVDNADFPDWRKVRLYDLNQRPNANFVYREMEEELF